MEAPGIGVKKRLLALLAGAVAGFLVLCARVAYIQTARGPALQRMAYDQQTRDRLITPRRGSILDRNGVGLALTRSVYAVSVIPAQIADREATARYLAQTLELDYAGVLDKVSRRVALVRIATKVEPEVAMAIRQADWPGVAVDEDVKRVYPYGSLAAQVIGFVGRDNQGVLGLEAKYDAALAGSQGKILTRTDSRGLEVSPAQERVAPVDGLDLVTTLDAVVQQYAEQTLAAALTAKGAKRGLILVMDPRDGGMLAMAVAPDFDLNDPFTINDPALLAQWEDLSAEEQTIALNKMWRNTAINDTYEPGSTFKIVTASAGLEEGVVTPESPFVCTGAYTVGDRRIKCWRSPRSHGAETFLQGVQNSCNPVFMQVAERLGADRFYEYLLRFGFDQKTGIDLPGEAVGILHKRENVGPVELATMSFGQSLQITPLQLLKAAAAAVNGGWAVTPHVGAGLRNEAGEMVETFSYPVEERILSQQTSDTMRMILESVVREGTGHKAYLPGYRVGGKTATSEKLPRKSGKYIASFLSFAPAEAPRVMALVLIDEPQGVYYGGTVAGPVMQELLANILPYLGVEPLYDGEEQQLSEVQTAEMPEVAGLPVAEAQTRLKEAGLLYRVEGAGAAITAQLPRAGETIHKTTTVILYTE